MKHPLRYVLVLALATSVSLGACSDDSSTPGDDNGGAGGDASDQAGSKTGGSSSNAGSGAGGKAGGAGAGAPAGGAAEGGGTGEGATGGAGEGGASGGAGAGGDAGGAGAELVYACGSDNLIQKTCSAWVAANCPDATDCSDCVLQRTTEREDFQTDPPCNTCNAKWDAFYQCQVDAFESNDLAAGVECVDGIGADGTLDCYPFLDDAIACEGYVGSDNDPKPCPATWPPPG
jgi:hypothetical protein